MVFLIRMSSEAVFHECFAHDGVSNLVLSMYIMWDCNKSEGLLEGLCVKYDMIPEFNGCLMHQNGKCEIEFRFYLN